MPGMNRCMTATPAGSKVTGGMDQPLEQALPLAAGLDDLLGFAIVDALIFERARHVVGDLPHVRLQVERRRHEMHRSRFVAVDRVVIVDALRDKPETSVERMQCIERVRLGFALLLHPLDQQLEHLHREAAIADAAQAQTKRLRRDAFASAVRQVIGGVGYAAGRVAHGRIEHVQPFGAVVSAGH
ncbi:Uncharacterised protein [Burkholderia pseudomallei]|nr:Uncharacterised protein [Burkholderia pseudomallei]